jgi:signal transduction histidine kinase
MRFGYLRFVVLLLMVWSTHALAEGLQDLLPPSEDAALEAEPSMPEPGLDERPVLSIAVLAIRGPETALNMWQATADYLTGHVAGYRFVIEPLDFDSIRQVMADEAVDFVLTNPGMYVEFEALYGARRIATLKNLLLGRPHTEFGAVIFRRADRTDIADIHDLRGKRFAMVHETAFSGWQMAWRQMLELGFDPYRKLGALYAVGTHDNVVYEVLEGRADAGTVHTNTFERMEQEGSILRSDFALIHENTRDAERFPLALSTQLYPEWPFAILPQTPQELAERVAIALMGMPPESEAARDGGYAGWTVPSNYERVGNTLRMLRVAPYEDHGEVTLQAVLQKYWRELLLMLLSLLLLAVVVARFRHLNLQLHVTQGQLQGELTERRRAEEGLREANRRKDVFLATLAHELRNPLAPIRTGLDLAQVLRCDAAACEEPLRMMDRQLTHLVHLVDDLLDVSRISRGKIHLQKERLDLTEVIDAAVQMSDSALTRGNRRLAVDVPTQPLHVEGDRVRLVQIVSNLLDNAVKFTDADGQIALRVVPEGERVEILVQDDGHGIAPERLAEIFEPFVQTEPGRGGGLGIGLSLVRSLVTMHGGTVSAYSEGLGCGATFTVSLPLCRSVPAQPVRHEAAETHPVPRRQVLVVDDNRDIAEGLRLILTLLMQAEVRVAYDGAEALRICEDWEPTHVLMDLGMPGMDGFETARRLRANHPDRAFRLVAISGWGREEDQEEARQAGFDQHLVKPVGVAELKAILAD